MLASTIQVDLRGTAQAVLITSAPHFFNIVANGRVATTAVFIEFLERLMVNASSPTLLVVDGLSTHRANSVKRCVQEQSRWLEVNCLPAYSPELNFDDLVWNNSKNSVIGRVRRRATSRSPVETHPS